MTETVYIFDVDGVLNDLEDYDPDPRVLEHIVRLLSSGTYVAINTGRGFEWIHENVVNPIRAKITGGDALERFFVSVEMGGLGVEFIDGTALHIKSAFSLAQPDIDTVRSEFENDETYSKVMHWYAKESMATLAKNRDVPLAEFIPYQKQLTERLKVIFGGRHIQVANSTDAVDVHLPEAGKWAGAELIFEWLRRKSDIQHDHFVCFGDSAADFEMARFFAEKSHETVFVCTNPSLNLSRTSPEINIYKTELPFHEGTNEYLTKNT